MPVTTRSHLQPLNDELRNALARLGDERIVERIWEKDPTVWSPDPDEIPAEITDRLGWLDLVREPPVADAEIGALVDAARTEEVRDAVLLGMGGSSLGAEALRSSFGARGGYPRLHVLDSTHPRWVRRVRGEIDPASTLFVVASKSGTTAEVLALFDYFWAQTEGAGVSVPGGRFVAVTDPGTPLLDLARDRDFRAVFTNPPDVGGRFSVLSRFGRVPAALAGVDVMALMESGHRMAERCGPGSAPGENPGAWLGAVLGAAASSGRDRLTFLAAPRIETFGLWAEQLIGESLGKSGRGLVPVTGEPEAAVERYGDDRLFVALHFLPEPDERLTGRVAALRKAGQPVVEIDLEELGDLGGELFRWQLATAVAGHLVGVHPFDQPDVESTKKATRRILDAFAETGELPAVDAPGGPGSLRAALLDEPPSYLALMAYADESAELEDAAGRLRRALLDDLDVTTTFGYGPRFLHSTGQLHKGGPGGGLFVQLIERAGDELEIPGRGYGFRTLLAAQADGDLAALQENGRRCLRFELGDDPAATLDRLAAEVEGIDPASDVPFL